MADIANRTVAEIITSAREATITFDALDKLVIVLTCVLFLLLVLFSLICILHPKCLLYAYCPFQQNRESSYAWVESHPAYGSIPNQPKDVSRKYQNGISKGQHASLWNHMTPLRESEHSDWSDISVPEIIEMKQDPSGTKRKSSRTSDYSSSASSVASNVHLESRLSYGIRFDRAASKLYIRVMQLGNFRVTGANAATAPYVKVRVYKAQKHFFTFKMKNPRDLVPTNLDTDLQTKIQRRTDNPMFNEVFDIKLEDPEFTTYAYYLKFLVCDFDKFSRHVVIGEITRDMSKIPLTSEEILYNDQFSVPAETGLCVSPACVSLVEAGLLRLRGLLRLPGLLRLRGGRPVRLPWRTAEFEENLGELHVALMYLPTAEKMSLVILNARGLKSMDGSKRNMETYVKVTMMYDGRPLKKTKTSSKANDPNNPTFNETFVFDVPAYQLDNVYFGISVIGVDKDKEDGRHLLGRLYIGVNFDPETREQWLEMVNNARKQVACWHKLRS